MGENTFTWEYHAINHTGYLSPGEGDAPCDMSKFTPYEAAGIVGNTYSFVFASKRAEDGKGVDIFLVRNSQDPQTPDKRELYGTAGQTFAPQPDDVIKAWYWPVSVDLVGDKTGAAVWAFMGDEVVDQDVITCTPASAESSNSHGADTTGAGVTICFDTKIHNGMSVRVVGRTLVHTDNYGVLREIFVFDGPNFRREKGPCITVERGACPLVMAFYDEAPESWTRQLPITKPKIPKYEWVMDVNESLTKALDRMRAGPVIVTKPLR